MNDQLQTLLDKQAIMELGHCYGSAIDTLDLDRLLTIFTPDARWYSDVHDTNGHAEIRAAVQRVADTLEGTQHTSTNQEVEVQGDRATMRSNYIATHLKAPLVPFVMAGAYYDDLVRTAEGWKITSRRLTISWTTGDPAVMGGVTGDAQY